MLVLGDDPETAQQAAAAFNQASWHVLLVFAPKFATTWLTCFHLNKRWNPAAMVMGQQLWDCLLLWRRDTDSQQREGQPRQRHARYSYCPLSCPPQQMHFSLRISPKCPNTPEIEHKVFSHICVVTFFRLLLSAGLLESSMRLKPHEAQSYRKKALWVSWVSIAVTIILAIAAFSECFLSSVLCLAGSGAFYISEKEMKKTVQSGSAAGCSGLRLKDRFVNYCGRLLIWVTPNSLIKQRPAWGTSGECVQGV